MNCGSGSIDTHEEIIEQACGIFYYPNASVTGLPCKYFNKCQRWIKRMIEQEAEPKELHRQYLMMQKAGEQNG